MKQVLQNIKTGKARARRDLVRQVQPSSVPEPEKAAESANVGVEVAPGRPTLRSRLRGWPYWRYARLALIVLAVVLVAWLGIKGWRIYRGLRLVQADMGEIQKLASGQLSLDQLNKVGPLISKSRQDVAGLNAEAWPFLWLAKGFGWVPVYGGDLAYAQEILALAESLTAAADDAFQGATPLVQALLAKGGQGNIAGVTQMLVEAQPAFIQAKAEMDQAVAARASIQVQRLDPKARALIVEKLDPYLGLFHDGLEMAVASPRLAGAPDYGPQTYLLLIQNEDELRATGGFITSAGTFVVNNGEIFDFVIEDSYAFDDPTQGHPTAPWQLQEYMLLPTVLLRDANWSPDFLKSAALAEYLYALTRSHGVDGVIAIDQYAVRSLLKVFGAVRVESVSNPINTENVMAFMRQVRGEAIFAVNRKSFMGELGSAILDKIKNSQDIAWAELVKVLQADLNAHHILLQLDEPGMAAVLAGRGWDGALRPGGGDFLMVVDMNMGFNKANAVVEQSLSYEVDLSNTTAPTGSLTVVQTNHATKGVPCQQFYMRYERSYEKLINRCYWDYLRVYKPTDTQYLDGSPHEVPGAWMVSGKTIPAQVDVLRERITGVEGFGTLLVVPGGESLTTSLRFQLPSGVIAQGEGTRVQVYHLHIQKQAGTPPQALTVRIRLPAGAKLLSSSPVAEVEVDGLSFTIEFNGDVEIAVTYQLP
jgi:hypothetical protein